MIQRYLFDTLYFQSDIFFPSQRLLKYHRQSIECVLSFFAVSNLITCFVFLQTEARHVINEMPGLSLVYRNNVLRQKNNVRFFVINLPEYVYRNIWSTWRLGIKIWLKLTLRNKNVTKTCLIISASNNMSPDSPNKKRKPGRPKKCDNVRPGVTGNERIK